MWRAAFLRAKESARKDIAQVAQVVADVSSPEGNVSGDVFAEDPARSNNCNCPRKLRPEMSAFFVVRSATLARDAEGLAGITAREDRHAISKRVRHEGRNIRPDRSRIEPPFFHSLDQYARDIRLDLDKNDRANSRQNSSQSEINPPVSCTKRGVCNCLGRSHIFRNRRRHRQGLRGVVGFRPPGNAERSTPSFGQYIFEIRLRVSRRHASRRSHPATHSR